MAVADLTFGREELAQPEEDSQARIVWRRFRRHKLAVAGLAIVIGLVLFCFVGPFISPFDPTAIPSSATFGASKSLPPMATSKLGLHILGTDQVGRDYLTRLMWGGRVSLSLAVIITLLTVSVGTLIGGISGFFGGWVDSITMRTVEFMLTLPDLPIFLILYTMLPQRGTTGSLIVLTVVLVVFGWMGEARLVRGMVLSLKNQDFTEASRAVGSSSWSIIRRHMIPNSLAPVIVAATLAVGGIVVAEASLSFLGFGVKPPFPSWGNMLQDAQRVAMTAPHLVFIPGFCIFMVSLSFNFIGDALRDALDPRLKM
jgi:peptide/nickel transport system permease protein